MIKNFYKKLVTTYFTLGVFVSSAFAQGNPPQLEGIFPVIFNAIEFIFRFLSIVAAAIVVYGAYMWMSAGGDPQKVKMAQGVLTWAIVGLIFFMTFGFFADFILGLLGVELPTPADTPFEF